MLQKLSARTVIIAFLFAAPTISDRAHAQDAPYTVVLKDKPSGLPLAGATVAFYNNKTTLTSDSAGHITIPLAVIRKNGELQISMTGYKSLSVNVKALDGLRNIDLEPAMTTLQEVVVMNNTPADKVRNVQTGYEVITAMEAKNLPAILGEVDIIKILQLKPGIKSAGEGLAGFYVRGGGADQNLIMIDGVPVYNPNHLLGLFSVFNNDAIKDARLYKSAYPAKYGGRLSSVLDVLSRSGSMDSLQVSGGIGFLSSRLSVESPIQKGRSSIIVSGRRTYFDLFTKTLNRVNKDKENYEHIPDYYFSDINLRSDWKINATNSLWATMYVGSDNFSSDADKLFAKFTWGNRTASLNWKTSIKSKAEITGSVFYSGYKYRLGNQYSFNNIEIRSAINTTGIKIMASTETDALRWQGGISAMTHKLNIGDFDSYSSLSNIQSGEKTGGNEWAAFINSEWDNDKGLAILGGVRLSGFNAGRKWYINPEPRIAARLNISESAALKGSYTRMYQYLHLASLSSASLPVDMWYPSTAKTRPQYSDQLSIGLSKALNKFLFFNLEGYYKWMKNQVEFKDGASIIGNPKLENDFVYGKANAYGVEVYLEKNTGRTKGWLGYTLSWVTRTFADINDGMPFKPRYDRRHDVSFVITHKINKMFMLSANWIYGSGAYTTVPVGRYILQDQAGARPRSIIPVYTQRNNYQLAAVHRMDINLVTSLKSKRGKQDITLSLYNAYSRRNPFYIQFTEVDDKAGYVTSIQPTVVSLFPLLPGISYNFKF